MKKLESAADMLSLTKILPFILVTTTTALFSTAIPVKVDTYCTPMATFKRNSFYQKNLNSVLASLTSQSSTISFSNSSFGTYPDDVYGLFFCRYDLPSSTCSSCIKAAVAEITSNCTKNKEAITWYDNCTLRYANRNIFSVEDESLFYWRISTMNVSMDIDQFNQVFSDTLVLTINQASYNNTSSSKRYFKTTVAKISSVDTLYVLVQCTPDIDSDSCARCLRVTVRDLPFGGTALGMFFRPSCMMMCDLAPFFEVPLQPPSSSPSSTKRGVVDYIIKAVIPGAVVLLILLLGITCTFLKTRRLHAYDNKIFAQPPGSPMEPICKQFDFRTLKEATDDFSEANKLGQGGLGIVYRGTLPDGLLVAIKRLSRISSQRITEFKMELAMLARLKDKNLVRLVGYYIEQEEWFIVNEFLPNLSLDKILFDSSKSVDLDWQTRYGIIEGIARGLQYLHSGTLPSIIHGALKSSNIFLDENMSPKISDFGIARLIKDDETTTFTTRISGAQYMAPDYIMTGRFSLEMDIYSFGVILLEILSGQSLVELLRRASILWNEGAIEQFMDPVLENKYSRIQAERCVQIGLLCIQVDKQRRPTITAVLGMLENQSLELPYPVISHDLFPR